MFCSQNVTNINLEDGTHINGPSQWKIIRTIYRSDKVTGSLSGWPRFPNSPEEWVTSCPSLTLECWSSFTLVFNLNILNTEVDIYEFWFELQRAPYFYFPFFPQVDRTVLSLLAFIITWFWKIGRTFFFNLIDLFDQNDIVMPSICHQWSNYNDNW